MSKIKKMIYAALCVALCVVLPLAFHTIPNAGSIILPMHIPVLLCGLLCGWPFGLACGVLAPILSSLITGMPPMAYVPSMICELAAYGAMSGVLYSFVRTKKIFADLYISLAGAMICGRIVMGAVNALLFKAGDYSLAMWTAGAFVTALPGIIIQLAIIPILVFALQKANLLEKRY